MYYPLSVAGIERLKFATGDDLNYERTWILLNKLLPEFVDSFNEFLEINKYLTPIPWDSDVVRAYSRRQMPLDMEYGNNFTLAIMQSLKRLIGKELSKEIDKWAANQATSIREPIEQQYKDAEMELKGLLDQKIKHEKYLKLRPLYFVITPIFMVFIFSIYFNTSEQIQYIGKLFNSIHEPYITIVSFVLAIIALLFLFTQNIKTSESKLLEARLNRQVNIAEDKLKRLEILRKADLKIIIEMGGKQN